MSAPEQQPLNKPAAVPPPYPGGATEVPTAPGGAVPPPVQPQGYGPPPPGGYAPAQPPHVAGVQQVPPPYGQPGAAPVYKTNVPPPPPGAAYPAQHTTVIINQQFRESPTACVCPNCHQQVVTQTSFEIGLLTWLIVGAIILFGGWIFCLCFIPFCIDACKDVRHTCPNCNYTIHYFKRM